MQVVCIVYKPECAVNLNILAGWAQRGWVTIKGGRRNKAEKDIQIHATFYHSSDCLSAFDLSSQSFSVTSKIVWLSHNSLIVSISVNTECIDSYGMIKALPTLGMIDSGSGLDRTWNESKIFKS